MIIVHLFFIFLLLFIILIAGVFWGSGGLQKAHSFRGAVKKEGVISNEETKNLKVIVWNMAYAYGIGSDGEKYQPKTKDEYIENLNQIAKAIAEHKADLVLLQEVDFSSGRSHGLDQAEYLATQVKLPFTAYARSWRANYIPFPYWPINRHFGRMDSGGAVLSRFPITENTIHLLKKPEQKKWFGHLYNLFYLFRYVQDIEVQIGKSSIRVLNLHWEAFDERNRIENAYKTKEIINRNSKLPLLIGGDFNSAFQKDYKGESPSAVQYLEIELEKSHLFNNGEKLNSSYTTFPAEKPTEQIDHVVLWKEAKVSQFQRLGYYPASDHRGLFIEFDINKIPSEETD